VNHDGWLLFSSVNFKVQRLTVRNIVENRVEVKKKSEKKGSECGFLPHMCEDGDFTAKPLVPSATPTADKSAGLAPAS